MTRLSRAGPLALVAAAVLARSPPLLAQTADQTALEQLFGEPVTTSATGKPQRASDVPAEMVIVTAADIRRSGAQSIPDALRFVPGLDVRGYGIEDQAVGVHGNNTALNPRVLVLLDGRQVYQDDYGLTAWSLIPVTMNEIRQIEIIKGPSAALYGFNAVDGVINIVTYDPLRDKVNDVQVSAGTHNQVSGQATATMQIADRIGVRLSAQGFRATEFPGSQGYDDRERPRSGMVALDGRWQIAPGLEWDVSASISSVDSDYFVDTGFYLPLGLKANSVRSKLSDDTALGILQLDAYRNENRTSDSKPIDSNNWREDVVVVQASDLIKFGNNTLRVAGEYRDNTITSPVQVFNGRLSYVNLAGSLMWDWRILPWLTINNALREDHLSLTHQGPQFTTQAYGDVYRPVQIDETSFNSGAVIKLSDLDTLRVTAARAVQLPSLVDLGFGRDYGFGGGIVVGNTGLEPSALLSYGIDYDRALPELHSTLRTALFGQRMGSSIGSPFGSGFTLTPSGEPLLAARDFGGSSEIGGEAGIKGSHGRLRWNASYSFAAVHDQSATALLLAAPSVSYQRQTPTHAVIFGGGYSWGRFDLDGQARWQSHFEDFPLNASTLQYHELIISNYVTIDARLAYQLADGITVSLVGQQLNRQSIVASAGVPMARRIIAAIEAKF